MKNLRSSYWNKVFSVFSGAAVAQAIPIIGSLLIARVYAPDAFGAYSTWLGISLVLTVCLTYRLEAAFGLEPDGQTRTELVVATIVLVLLTGLVLGIGALIVYLTINSFPGDVPPVLMLLLVPQSVGAALSLIWQSWAANNGDIKSLSLIRIVQALLITVLQIVIGLVDATAVSLSMAQVIGVWVGVLFSLLIMPLGSALPRTLTELCRLLARVWNKYRRFPTLALPADLINSAAAQMPVIVLGSRFGPDVAGYYALATRMMGAPISILGGAVRDVFKRTANEDYRKLGNCRKIYVNTFWVLLSLSALMVAVIIPFAEDIFSIFFGANWAMGGVMASWLVPMYALRFMASPLSYTFYIVQKQNVDLLWQIGLLVITIFALFAFNKYEQVIVYYSAGYAFMYVIYLTLSFKYSTNKTRSMINKEQK